MTIGIDIAPALAAAGIFGLAISLGAQTLIKDIIGGLTILIEDEFRVGDAVEIGLQQFAAEFPWRLARLPRAAVLLVGAESTQVDGSFT